MQAIAEALKAIEIKITKAGGEKLFGSITNIDIAAVLAKGGQVIDENSSLGYR
jgi:large subunit ribosomal protein L9